MTLIVIWYAALKASTGFAASNKTLLGIVGATICGQADQSLNSYRTLGEEAQGECVQGRRGVGKALTFRGQQVQVIHKYMQCIRGSIEA
jgi:hypothetical protein